MNILSFFHECQTQLDTIGGNKEKTKNSLYLHRQDKYLVVMCPSRAEGVSGRLGSARDLFQFSSELKIDLKRARFSVEDIFFIINLSK